MRVEPISVMFLVATLVAAAPSREARDPRDLRGRSHAVSDTIPGVHLACPDLLGGPDVAAQGQHVDATGAIDSAWEPSPTTCLGSAFDVTPVAVPDGSGGRFVVWSDRRGEDADIRALRLDVHGEVVAGWPTAGVLVCAHPWDQDQVAACADGAGGVIVAWQDLRDPARAQSRAQRLDASGAAVWAPGGLAIEPDTTDQSSPAIGSDGAGGALIVWQARSGAGGGLRAATVNAQGVVTARAPPAA